MRSNKKYKITISDGIVICAIGTNKNVAMTISEVAEASGLKRSTAATVIGRLHAAGLITKQQNSARTTQLSSLGMAEFKKITSPTR